MSTESPSNKSTPLSGGQRIETANHIHLKGGTVILQPITMRIPNRHGIHSPSQLRPQKTVSYKEFLTRYANHPRGIHVCFDDDPSPTTILEQSELVTAYGFGLDCWYIVTGHKGAPDTFSEE